MREMDGSTVFTRTTPGMRDEQASPIDSRRSLDRQRVPRHVAHGMLDKRAPRKIRYTEAEWAAVTERARACGRAPARYVREVSLGTVPKASRPRVNAPLIRDLGAIANTLRAVRGQVVTGGMQSSGAPPTSAVDVTPHTTTQLDQAVAELLDVIRRLG